MERASAAKVCTSAARKTGDTPCAARSGQSPLAKFDFRIRERKRIETMTVGVAGVESQLVIHYPSWISEIPQKDVTRLYN